MKLFVFTTKKGMEKIEYRNFYQSVIPQLQDGLLSLQRRKERSPEQTICESLKKTHHLKLQVMM